MARRPRAARPPARAVAPAPGRAARASRSRAETWAGPVLVVAITAAAFWPALDNGFVWDDTHNLVDNPSYRGLGMAQLRWMLTTTHLGHWIPLTWVTLGADWLLWGDAPWGYHLTNVLLHAAAAAALCVLARRLLALAAGVEAPGLSVAAVAAALAFALHPLRVESVAWVTERRDVLSGLLAVLAALAWTEHARGRRRAYTLALGCFVLAALAKSIVVTLPLVLLVLDVYPLRRVGPGRWSAATVRPLLLEKIPFLVVSLSAGVVAVVAATRDARVFPLATLGLADRLTIAAYGTGFYLEKSVLPLGLGPHYELVLPLSSLMPWALAGAALAVVVTAGALLARRRIPALLAGWAAYLILLSPVSGLLQNGPQVAADRYSYLPAVPLALLAGGGVLRAWRRARGAWRPAVGALALATLGALVTLTWIQIGVWRDSGTLWAHALAVQESSLARYNLGVALGEQGRWEEAAVQHRRAIELRPAYPEAHYNLGVAMSARGRWDEAIASYRRALEIAPGFQAQANLGVALGRLGRWAEARAAYQEALRLRPEDAAVLTNLGVTFAREARWDEAIAWYGRAVEARPAHAAAHYNWGVALARQERWAEAAERFREVLRREPRAVEALSDLGLALAMQGQLDKAIETLRAALALRPDYGPARDNLELALSRRRNRDGR